MLITPNFMLSLFYHNFNEVKNKKEQARNTIEALIFSFLILVGYLACYRLGWGEERASKANARISELDIG